MVNVVEIKLMDIENSIFSKEDIEKMINNCSWPSQCKHIVLEEAWDYEDAIKYFERLDDFKFFITDQETFGYFGYMAATLTIRGWIYFFSRFMVSSMNAIESELTFVLLNFLCTKFSSRIYKDCLTKEQTRCIKSYLRYMYSKTKNTEINDSLLLDWSHQK